MSSNRFLLTGYVGLDRATAIHALIDPKDLLATARNVPGRLRKQRFVRCSTDLLTRYGGCSVGAVNVLTGRNFTYMNPVGWGLVLIFTIYIGFHVSGAQLNPAMSFVNYLMGQISFKRFVRYCVSTHRVIPRRGYEAINALDGGTRQVYGDNRTADIFATYPQDYLTWVGGMIDQVLTTAIMCINALAISDERNHIPPFFQPPLLGLSLWFIVSAWSANCGAALNPTRDLGPRLFTLCAGYGWDVFSYDGYTYFWVPIIGPMLGAVLGAFVYQFFIGDYVPDLQTDGSNSPSECSGSSDDMLSQLKVLHVE
ncbi:Protein AQP-3 [Aphelenchoides avenae]|nr:Protein AQP-3 [Aphelenchus avenae]